MSLRFWIPPFFWAALIFAGSSIQHPPTPNVPGVPMDKVAHATEYGIFGALLFRGFHRGAQLPLANSVILTAFFAMAYGFSDETHQFFVGRDCEWGDVVADSVGGALGAFVTAFYQARIKRRIELST